jgi:hypothetical protein
METEIENNMKTRKLIYIIGAGAAIAILVFTIVVKFNLI